MKSVKSIERRGGKKMTIREVAKVLGVDVRTIQRYAKALFPGTIENGRQTLLDEAQVTRVKMELVSNPHLDRSVEVINMPKTEMEKSLIVAQAWEIIQERVRIAESKAEQLRERLDEAGDWWTVKRVEMETGKHYRWQELKKWSVENGYGIKRAFDQNYGEVNLYHIDVWNAVYGVEL
jgi:transposase